MRLGIVTYDSSHLKTEQLVIAYSKDARVDTIEIFALPFIKRPQREVLIPHRPDQIKAVTTGCLVELDKVSFRRWDGRESLHDRVDVFVIAGAGILDIGFAGNKPIVNAHPGIIPTTRGLDSFKWAIYEGDPLGVTLHLIDNEVDKGELLAIERTPIFLSDTVETLSRRHYELEVELMKNVLDTVDKRVDSVALEKPAHMRMPIGKEVEMLQKFDAWKHKMLTQFKDQARI
ncbi:MAG: hypothetical protein DHS20C01_14030 [marine bacterium B5-7]|nr:MAG: hypothetical protein DHS20C01_14030 [marine bacterium B5-7]